MPKKQAKKTTTKKTKRKSTARRSRVAIIEKYYGYALSVFIVVGLVFGLGYYMGLEQERSHQKGQTIVDASKIFEYTKEYDGVEMRVDEAGFGLEGMIEKLQKRKKERDEKERLEKKQKSTVAKIKGKKPKLVIIIDDVSQRSQLKAIKALPFKVTPSIFPPSQMSRSSYKLTYGLKHFMIHLPMQSSNAKLNKMTATMMISHSAQKIRDRIKQIRKLFPNGKYINNHTGSVFTSNYRAMKIAYRAIRDEGFIFVDSRTSGKTKVKKIAKEFKDTYIVRDVFIDNTQNKQYILKQLAKAVKIAKKHGSAIAIGHPHKVTMRALMAAKSMFRGLDVVYIDELYK